MLRHGERLDRPTFHDRYVALVESGVAIKAELLEGVVYLEGDLEGDLGGDLEGAEEMVSMRRRHGSWHVLVSGLVDRYLIATPGTDGYGNTSTLTDEPSEPQPGFWLDNAAVLTRQTAAAWATLETGLATEEHAAFVRRLAMPRSAGWPPQRSRPPRRFARLTG